MPRRFNILNAPDGAEQLKAVDWQGKGIVTGASDPEFTYWIDSGTEDVTLEFYGTHPNNGLTETIFQFGNGAGNGSAFLIMQFTNAGRIRCGYLRSSGSLFYRRDYTVTIDGNPHHWVFTNNPGQAGSNKQRFYEDGVELSPAASAYNGAAQTKPATPYLNIGGLGSSTNLNTFKTAYVSIWKNLWLPAAANVAEYYTERQNLDARRSSEPVVGTIVKPDLFFCANDIVDLSVGWTDSNAGVDLSELGTLTNSDIIIPGW